MLRVKGGDVPHSSRLKEASGWQLVVSSPRLDWPIERLALTARVLGGALGEHDKMVAVATGSEILLWALQPEGGGSEIGKRESLGFPGGSSVKNLPAVQETRIRSLGWEDPPEKGRATHSSIVAWRIWPATVCGVPKSRAQLSN